MNSEEIIVFIIDLFTDYLEELNNMTNYYESTRQTQTKKECSTLNNPIYIK